MGARVTIGNRVLGAFGVLGFTALFLYYLVPVLMLSSISAAVVLGFIALHTLSVVVLTLRGRGYDVVPTKLPLLLFALSLLLTIPFRFMTDAFGTRDIGSLLLTISENELPAMVSVGLDGFLREIVTLLVLGAVLLVMAHLLARNVPLGRPTVIGFALLAGLFGPIPHYFYRAQVPHPAHALINQHLPSLGPTILTRPQTEDARNLVIFYLESLERSYRDIPESAAAFSGLAHLEDKGLAFLDVQQAIGSAFTIGGIVASQCGVPVMPRGLVNITRRTRENVERIPDSEDFMPEVVCLGDVLAEDGYELSYINGSSLKVFSKGNFFRSHGFSTVKGLESYPGWETETRRNVWGMNDDLLFERLAEELERLAKGPSPFVLSALTLGTHGPNGFPDETCPTFPGKTGPMLSAVACAADHIGGLLDELERLGLADDTLVVLLSDHLAYRNTFHKPLRALGADRSNYVVVLGAGQGTNRRSASMYDVYPTLLELLGYRIESGRAGMGQSLLSEAPTLVEKEGLRTLNAAIRNNADLQARLWSSSEGR